MKVRYESTTNSTTKSTRLSQLGKLYDTSKLHGGDSLDDRVETINRNIKYLSWFIIISIVLIAVITIIISYSKSNEVSFSMKYKKNSCKNKQDYCTGKLKMIKNANTIKPYMSDFN